jgi:hypothetical protein
MAKFRNQKNSLIAGELSPTALGRTDLPQYPHACELLRNAIPFLSGGAYRRPGTYFEKKIDAGDYAPALIPFVVSRKEAYCLIVSKVSGGSGYIDVLRPTSNNQRSTQSSASGSHSWVQATVSTLSTVGYYDEWHDVQYVQSADVLYLVHPRHKPKRLYRTATDTFALTDFDQDSSGSTLTGTSFRDVRPYLQQNTTGITLSISAATTGTGRTVTASSAFFNSAHVGAVFKSNDGTGTIGCFVVTGYTSATSVTVTVIVALGTTSARSTWWESAWSDYRGWPRSVSIFQQRLVYGGTTYSPDSLWLGQTGNYDVMSVSTTVDPRDDTTNDHPFTIELSSLELNQIQWISSEKSLLVGTLGDEWLISFNPTTTDPGFGCVTAFVEVQSHYGSSYTKPVRAGSEVMFSLGTGKEIRSLVFNEREDSYVADPVQLLFDHYPKTDLSGYTGDRRFRRISWDRSRHTLWCCDTAGNLFGLTRDRQLGVTAWHTHQLGGFDSAVTGGSSGAGISLTVDPAYYSPNGSAVSLCMVPNPMIGTDDVWIAVKRYIDGNWEFHIERMIGESFPNETAYRYVDNGHGNYLVDSATFNTGDYPLAEDYVFGDLDQIEGETPVGTASNTKGLFTITGDAVASGNTTMQQNYPTNITGEATVVVFGLGFNTIIVPVRTEAGSQIGTSQGALKRIHRAIIRFYRTMYAKVGTQASDGKAIDFRTGTAVSGLSAEIYSGDKDIYPDGGYDENGYVYIQQDKPLPFAVVSIVSEGMTSDG